MRQETVVGLGARAFLRKTRTVRTRATGTVTAIGVAGVSIVIAAASVVAASYDLLGNSTRQLWEKVAPMIREARGVGASRNA